MAEFTETINNVPKILIDIQVIVNTFSSESKKTKSQVTQSVIYQRRMYEEAIGLMRETLEDINRENDFEDNKNDFLMKKRDFHIKNF